MISTLLVLTALFVPQDSERVALTAPAEASVLTLDGEIVIEFYEVQDILTELTSGVRHGVVGEGPIIPEKELSEAEQLQKVVSTFTDSIIEYLDPPFVVGANELSTSGMSLAKTPTVVVFSGTAQQHAWLQAFIGSHRGLDQFMIVDTRFMSGPRGGFRSAKKGSANYIFEDQAEIDAYVQKMNRKPKVEIVMAPQVMTSSGRKASISIMNKTAYVESVTMRIVEPGGIEIADPEIATFKEGIEINIDLVLIPGRAQLSEEGEWVVPPGRTVALHLAIENSTVERPIPTRTVRVNSNSDDAGVKVSTPQVTRVSLEADLRLKPGSGILIGGPSSDEDRDVAILVSLPTKELKKLRKQRQIGKRE